MPQFRVGDRIRCNCGGYCTVEGVISRIRGEEYIVRNSNEPWDSSISFRQAVLVTPGVKRWK